MGYLDGERHIWNLEFDLQKTEMSTDGYLEAVEGELDDIVGKTIYGKEAKNWLAGAVAFGAASGILFLTNRAVLGLSSGSLAVYGGKKTLEYRSKHRAYAEDEPELDEILESFKIDEGEARLILEP